MTGKERVEKSAGERDAAPISPSTPHSAVSNGSVFLSDDGQEDESVYYTPRPVFVFPRTHPRLQSTALPAMDSSEDYDAGALAPPTIPDQISAISNRSSSFMAIRPARQQQQQQQQQQLAADQISAIPNISSSFMEIPPQHQLNNGSFPAHSASFSAVSAQQSGSSFRNESSFLADISLPVHGASFDSSYVRATGSRGIPHQKFGAARPFISRKNGRPGPQGATKMTLSMGLPKGHTTLPPSSVKRSQPTSRADKPSQQQRLGGKSEASLLKGEDPAIMHIGKGMLRIAEKSSLNANASEFIPRGPPAGVRLAEVRQLDPVPENLHGEMVASSRSSGNLSTRNCEQVRSDY